MASAIIYVRVSDARQVDNTSLASQETICREWCDRNGLSVAKVFVERGESAKSAQRTEFQAMFRHIADLPKGSISALVVYKFDRFSRNVDDGAVYRLELRKFGVELRSVTEATDNTPGGRLLTTMLSAIGQFDNDQKAERTLSGMKSRVNNGSWVWQAPVGYLNGSKSGPSLIPDPDRAPLIRKLFELVATGEHTKVSALATVTALGLRTRKGAKLTQETLRRVLTNPLYVGEIEVKKWGKSIQGDFEPLMERGLFDRVQMILTGRAPTPAPHTRDREEFPLRGLILCPDCKKPVTAGMSTGKAKKKFGYYRCHRANGHMNIRAEKVEDAFVDLLGRLTPSPERMALIERVFRASWTERLQGASAESASLKKELAKQEARKTRILEQMADGILDAGDFATLRKQTADAIAEIRQRLGVADANVLDLDSAIEYLMHLLLNTQYLWQTNDLRAKQKLQRRLFPHGLTWTEEGFGTPVTHSIYSYLGDDSISESGLEHRMGFEPMNTGFADQRVSHFAIGASG